MAKWINLEKADLEIVIGVLAEAQISNHRHVAALRRINAKLVKTLNAAPIKTASAKQKGRELQQWVCRHIAEITNIPYDQQDDHCPIHSREMGQAGLDIILREPALSRFPFAVECKSTESLALGDAIVQAQKNVTPNTDWIVVHRNKRMVEPIVIMGWSGFEALARDRLHYRFP